ncbi:MAG: SufS family cysteine desulfurase [bacterium]
MSSQAFFSKQDLVKATKLRHMFPIFEATPSLCYLDSAATTHKPLSVIKILETFYKNEYATVHRGVYSLSQEATQRCEGVRQQVADFLGAALASEIVFVRGTTEAINLVAATFPAVFATPGQEILITEMEHHANIVPWQLACERYDLTLKVVPIRENGTLDIEVFDSYLTEKTALVALCHASNILGTVNPVRDLIDRAHACGAKVLLDGAQGPSHMSVNVQELDCDFYCFSGHKLFGPTGIGVLYGKYDILDALPPYQGGGAMIDTVRFSNTTYALVPARFEAGTPAISEIVGLGAAIDFVKEVGADFLQRYEKALLAYAMQELAVFENLSIYGKAEEKIAIISFNLGDIHPHDAGTILDTEGVALRAGHHCAQPLMQYYDVAAMLRASFSIYNLPSDVDVFVKALAKVVDVMT